MLNIIYFTKQASIYIYIYIYNFFFLLSLLGKFNQKKKIIKIKNEQNYGSQNCHPYLNTIPG